MIKVIHKSAPLSEWFDKQEWCHNTLGEQGRRWWVRCTLDHEEWLFSNQEDSVLFQLTWSE